MKILSIETSCDDTSVAILEARGRKTASFNILSNIVSSQTEIHAPFGGIVPNLAARAHQRNLPVVFQQAQEEAKTKRFDLITVTNCPGLEPSLWAGVNFAKSLSLISGIPILGVNHLHGHLLANLIENPNIKFPALGLIVSGGHTQIVLMKNHTNFKILGETRDDAAGEAFDKVAKLLDLGYPGGPTVSRLAEKLKSKIKNQKSKIIFPRPMLNSDDYDFSFSGLKTAVLYLVKSLPEKEIVKEETKVAICAEFQQAVIDVIVNKMLKATKKHKVKSILCGGGVMANKELRKQIQESLKNNSPKTNLHIPPMNLCTDNAAMIAVAGYYKFLKKSADNLHKIHAHSTIEVGPR